MDPGVNSATLNSRSGRASAWPFPQAVPTAANATSQAVEKRTPRCLRMSLTLGVAGVSELCKTCEHLSPSFLKETYRHSR